MPEPTSTEHRERADRLLGAAKRNADDASTPFVLGYAAVLALVGIGHAIRGLNHMSVTTRPG